MHHPTHILDASSIPFKELISNSAKTNIFCLLITVYGVSFCCSEVLTINAKQEQAPS
jgi:hypothetical protein